MIQTHVLVAVVDGFLDEVIATSFVKARLEARIIEEQAKDKETARLLEDLNAAIDEIPLAEKFNHGELQRYHTLANNLVEQFKAKYSVTDGLLRRAESNVEYQIREVPHIV